MSTFTATPSSGAMVAADGVATFTLTVTIKDAAGAPLSGVTVSLSSTQASDVLSTTSATTAADGTVVATLAATAAGARTLSASLSGFALTTTATFVAGAPSPSASTITLTNTGPFLDDGVSPANVLVTVVDDHSNPVAGVEVSLQVTPATQLSGAGPLVATDAQGKAAFALTSTASGSRVVGASLAGTSVTATLTLDFVAGAPVATTSTLVPGGVVAVGTSLPLVVTVRDAQGSPVPGASVNLTSSLGAADSFVGSSSGLTGIDGTFTGDLTSTLAGARTVSADVSLGSATFTLTASAGLVAGPPDPASSTVALHLNSVPLTTDPGSSVTLTAGLFDAAGNPCLGQKVTFGADLPPYAFTAVTEQGGGTYVTTLTSSMVGQKTITVSSGAWQTTKAITFAPGAISPSRSTVVAGAATATADNASLTTISVTVRDDEGNPLAGKTVTLAPSGSGVTMSTPTITDALGVSISQVKASAVGVQVFSATAGGVSLLPRATIAWNPAAPVAGNSTLVASTSQVIAGGTFSLLTLTAKDPSGNVVPGASMSFQSSQATGGSFTPVGPVVTDARGVATVRYSSTSQSPNVFITANGPGGLSKLATLSVIAGTVSSSNSSLASAPASAPADGSSALVVSLTLRSTTNIALAAHTIAMACAGCSVSFPAGAVTSASGTVSAQVTSHTAGTSPLLVTDVTTNTAVGVLSLAFTAGAPVVANSTFSVASGVVQSGQSVGLSALVKDLNGNPVSGATVSFSSSSSSDSLCAGTCSAGAVTALTAADGTATVSLTGGLKGTHTVTASVGAQAIGGGLSLTVSPGAAASVAFTTQPTGVKSGVALAPAPVVTVFDAAGNVTSAPLTVTATVSLGNGTLSGGTVRDAVWGQASFENLVVTGGGAQTLAATSALPAATSGSFDVTP
jgi:adhesin/invasin